MHLFPKKREQVAAAKVQMWKCFPEKASRGSADCPRKSNLPKMKWSAYHLSGSESPLVDPLSEMGSQGREKRGAKKCAWDKLFHSTLTLLNKTWCSREPVSLIEVPGASIRSPLFAENRIFPITLLVNHFNNYSWIYHQCRITLRVCSSLYRHKINQYWIAYMGWKVLAENSLLSVAQKKLDKYKK